MRRLLFLLLWFNAFNFCVLFSIESTKVTNDAEVNQLETTDAPDVLKKVLQGHKTLGEYCNFDSDCKEMYACKSYNDYGPSEYSKKTCQLDLNYTGDKKKSLIIVGTVVGVVVVAVILYVLYKFKCDLCCDDSWNSDRRRTITPPRSPSAVPPDNLFQRSGYQTRETRGGPTSPSAPSVDEGASNFSDLPPPYIVAITESKPMVANDKSWDTFEQPPDYASINIK